MQRPRVCISHSVWVLMALQTCLGLSTFLCHGWIFSEPLNETDTKYGYCPYRHLLSLTLPLTGAPAPITAPSSVWVFVQSCSGVSLNCLTFQWSPPSPQGLNFLSIMAPSWGAFSAFLSLFIVGEGDSWWFGSAHLPGDSLRLFMPPTDHVTQPQVSEIAWKYISSSFVQFLSGKKKGHQGSGREYVCIHSPQNCLKKGWRADQMA